MRDILLKKILKSDLPIRSRTPVAYENKFNLEQNIISYSGSGSREMYSNCQKYPLNPFDNLTNEKKLFSLFQKKN